MHTAVELVAEADIGGTARKARELGATWIILDR